MQLTIHSFENGKPIPEKFAMGKPANPATFADNLSPHLSWSDVPEGTQSFAVICVDPDAPTVPDDVNQEGKSVPYELPRADFYHWVLVDIPADRTALPEGLDSQGVTPKGKPAETTEYGVRGINDYTSWFAGDADMAGNYGGYDGPFPPWNDERVHRYIFRLYALATPSLGLSGNFTAADALKAMEGKVLAQAEWTGTYAIYPDARR